MSGGMGRLMRLGRIEPRPRELREAAARRQLQAPLFGTLADEQFTWLSEKATGYWLVACGAVQAASDRKSPSSASVRRHDREQGARGPRTVRNSRGHSGGGLC